MNFHKNFYSALLFVSTLLNFFFISKYNSKSRIIQSSPLNKSYNLKLREEFLKSNKFLTRDYIYYKCNDRRRLGGLVKPVDKYERVDGAWYVCFDGSLAPVVNNCNVLSFGINEDESFDLDLNSIYGCNVFSFDPFVESERFKKIRKSHRQNNSYLVEVNKKWKFYRVGITGSWKKAKNFKKIGWIDTLENVIKLIKMKNKVIDIFKMDIEWNEIDVLEHFNIDYACTYFKQLLLETHSYGTINNLYYLVQKLEKCFSLFYRDSRLIAPVFNPHYDVVKEAAKNRKTINLGDFGNEINLSNFLLSTGELYFINENFRSK